MTSWRSQIAATAVVGMIAGLAAATAGYGVADSLLVSPHQLGAATASIPKCATAGMTVFENVSGVTIATVTVSNIDPACAGGTLSLTVNNGASSSSAAAVVPGGGGSMTVALGTAVPFIDNASVDLVVLGP
ncbi:MAG TPA: hypothetical protein VF990_00270 [Candidatus Dormibacteraeota bacterium]